MPIFNPRRGREKSGTGEEIPRQNLSGRAQEIEKCRGSPRRRGVNFHKKSKKGDNRNFSKAKKNLDSFKHTLIRLGGVQKTGHIRIRNSPLRVGAY